MGQPARTVFVFRYPLASPELHRPWHPAVDAIRAGLKRWPWADLGFAGHGLNRPPLLTSASLTRPRLIGVGIWLPPRPHMKEHPPAPHALSFGGSLTGPQTLTLAHFINASINSRSAPVASSIMRSSGCRDGLHWLPVSSRNVLRMSGVPIAQWIHPSHAGVMYAGVSFGRSSSSVTRSPWPSRVSRVGY